MRIIFVAIMILISVAAFGQDPLPLPTLEDITIDVAQDVEILTLENVAAGPDGASLWEPSAAVLLESVIVPVAEQIHERMAQTGQPTIWLMPVQPGSTTCRKVQIGPVDSFVFWVRMRVRVNGYVTDWQASWWVLCINLPGLPIMITG